MKDWMLTHYGNPSGLHPLAWTAKERLEQERQRLAWLLGAPSPQDILFTSGGTESNHLAIHSALQNHVGRSGHVIATAIEHSSVLNYLRIGAEGRAHRGNP